MKITDILPSIPQVKRLVASSPNVDGGEADFWIWFRSLQGLVNRREPHLYVMQGADVSPGSMRATRQTSTSSLPSPGVPLSSTISTSLTPIGPVFVTA